MIKTKIAIAALCLLALPGVTVFAGQGGFFEFEADCNLEILGEPDLHKPFEAIFTIIPRHDLIHTRGVEDTIKLKSYEGVTLLEGDTLWTGFMQRDKIYTLRARFVVDTAIYFRIHGVAKVVQALGIAAYPRGMDDMGAIATKAASSRLYDFTIHSQPTKPKIYCNEDSSIEITPVTIENLGPPPIISGPSKVQITQSTNKHIITNYEKNQSIGDTNYIYIDHQSVIKMDTIHIHPAKTNIFFFGRNIPNIQSQFEEMLPLNKINDSTYEMNTTDYLPEKLDILINDTTKIIPIRSLSIYTVCGEASYVDNESNINPCEHMFINADYYDPLWDVYEYEISKPDPAYYTSNYNYPANPPWQYSPQWEGASVPGSINVSLWDIYDEFDDDNYMEGSYIWGHNNDHNSSCYWRGIDAMWDVLTNFDPQPNNSDHDYCWNIYEFIHGWRTFGYPVDSVFVNIFEAHGVAVFIPGDADNDKSVNVLDATCIINYLYKGLPAPEHLSAADINADCGVNLLDVTCLINYLYRGGPAPLVGCYNYYSS